MTTRRYWFFLLAAATTRNFVFGDVIPSMQQVLGQYTENQTHLMHCVLVTDAEMKSMGPLGDHGYSRIRTEFRRQGDKAQLLYAERNDDAAMPPALADITLANMGSFDMYANAVTTPDGAISFFRYPRGGSDDEVITDSVTGEERVQFGFFDATTSWIRGWPGRRDTCRLDDSLRHASNASIMRSAIAGDSSDCYLLQGRTDGGKYAVWFDTGRGANIIRARIERGALDKVRGIPLWVDARAYVAQDDGNLAVGRTPFDEKDARVACVSELENVALMQVDGVWLPAHMRFVENSTDRFRRHSSVDVTLRVTSAVLRPSYPSGMFDVNSPVTIPRNTRVLGRHGGEMDPVPRVWRDGRVVTSVDEKAVSNIDASADAERLKSIPTQSSDWPQTLLIGGAALLSAIIAAGGPIGGPLDKPAQADAIAMLHARAPRFTAIVILLIAAIAPAANADDIGEDGAGLCGVYAVYGDDFVKQGNPTCFE